VRVALLRRFEPSEKNSPEWTWETSYIVFVGRGSSNRQNSIFLTQVLFAIGWESSPNLSAYAEDHGLCPWMNA